MAMLLTVAEAAQRAGVSGSLVYQWCDERRLAHLRAGGNGRRGKILIDPADLDFFLASLKVQVSTVLEPPLPRKKFRHLAP